ncbi:hypothetical protein RRG08_017115 [Elysia crispata]|uniref:Uncharacterized protein n=1 Tax=Elysia crispata TaxID=231223 RepID=A0AAE0ZNS8_9GAST|nr:hypothetical protein RRG08_017115 [Elysia crispata]
MVGQPMRSEYDTFEKRIATFTRWPENHFLSKNAAANAGFFFSGYSDCVRCFFCGGGLRHWEPQDDVRVEHARWFPKCQFLQQTVGQDFINVVGDLKKGSAPISLSAVESELRRRQSQMTKLNSKL